MSWLRRLLAAFRGSDSGQSLVEYLIIVGTCALVGIAAFTRYGQAVKSDLTADAKHIEGEGLPNTESILSTLGADYNEVPGWCVKPNYCFGAGTPVQAEAGDRPIESIRIGDRIWARDVETGAIALRPVVNTYRTARVPVVDLQLTAGLGVREHLAVTRNHLFWVEGRGWVQAQALGASSLWSTDARLSANLLELSDEPTTVYNLEVSELHSYFVGHSHVLVHNGDPDSTACPLTPAQQKAQQKYEERVICGDSGAYRYDLGGGSAYKIPEEQRISPGLNRDHVPSSGALKLRAEQLLDGLAKRIAKGKCRHLNKEEEAELEAALAKALADAKAKSEIEVADIGFTIAEPIALHQATRTYGNDNKSLIPEDAANLQAAALKDSKRIRDLIKSGKYDLPDDCAEKIRAALDSIAAKTQKQYDAELTALARQELEKSGYIEIFEATCQ